MKKLAVAALILSSLSGGAYAHEAGEFFIRAGSATVRPTEGSDNVLGMGGFNVSNNTQLGLTFTYMATDNVGVELLAATPFRHRVGFGPTGDIATVHHLPPTLMAQWYFGDSSSKVRPYIGAGLTTPPSLMRNLTIPVKRRALRSQPERFVGHGGAGWSGLSD
jgi:outer membrane protein